MNLVFQSIILVVAVVTLVSCHGNMLLPYTWFDKEEYLPSQGKMVFDYVGIKSGLQCYAGHGLKNKKLCPTLPHGCEFMHPGGICFWYKNYTKVERPMIFEPVLRTYGINDHYSYYDHPWRAPGRAPIDSPCGVVGGNMNGCVDREGNRRPCAHNKGGFAHGVRAEEFDYDYEFAVTNYTRGEEIEVAWGITANHGGGYSYRLCKLPEEGIKGLREECFQQMPLDFVGNMQYVQYGEDKSTRIAFIANRTRINTFPPNSQWTKNPIPACLGNLGGFYDPVGGCPNGLQFPPPAKDLFGFGANRYGNVTNFKFSIIDKVKIPDEIEPGKYVLSFRWDCEQTPQVWNTCSSINLA